MTSGLMPLHLALPLLAAFTYVAGALWLKRAAELGANVWRITCTCNWMSALAFTPLLLLGGNPVAWHQAWQPALVALLFLLGQLLLFLALRIGDVSVTTPVLGIKIILVAVFTMVLLGERVSVALWVAAALSSVAIALLNRSGRIAGGNVGLSVLASAAAASAYALFDVLVQKWSPQWGSGRFLPAMMAFVALYSVALWPLRKGAKALRAPASFRRALLAGAGCLGVQSVMFISAVALYGSATAANVLYSSRGLWSVAAVWLVGHWFRNEERQAGRKVFIWRFCGAALLLVAITLVLLA
jgi:drug/metabolite transporter (DMT)-like permease